MGSVTRLDSFIKLIVEHVMMMKLDSNCSFHDLAEEIGGSKPGFGGIGIGILRLICTLMDCSEELTISIMMWQRGRQRGIDKG